MADRRGFSRRRVLGAGAVAAGVAGVGLTATAGARSLYRPTDTADEVVSFHGARQAGVATSPQAYAALIAFDLRPEHTDVAGLRAVMRLWSEDAARLTQGVPALADTEPELAADPARLTVTVGWGPELFAATGLDEHRPGSLAPLPRFSIDRLEPRWSGGQLMLQICADSLLTVSHASRVLTKNVRSLAAVRWIQRGFRSPSHAAATGTSMRNLMGQVDGTVNLTAAADLERLVWDDGSRQAWFANGTIVVLRRVRAEMDSWDELDRNSKELAVGRSLATGAPLTGHRESDVPDFGATVNGITVIPPNAHIAMAHHRTDDEQFLRRPYNYDDVPDPGQLSDSGLLFLAYQRDPVTQFVPVQQRLADFDALNPWITPVGSAVFAILPGIEKGQYLGEPLLS